MHIEHTNSYIAITFPCPLRTLSSAVFGGGYKKIDTIVNIKTNANALIGNSPDQLVSDFLKRKFPGRSGIGLLTSAKIEYAQFIYACEKDIHVLAAVTAGTSNALNIAERTTTDFSGGQTLCGTINTIVITDGFLLDDCMVSTAISATEAKTAALIDLGIKSTVTGNQATGTGTDSIVIVSGNGIRIRYAGGHTLFGQIVGETVYSAVKRSLLKQGPDTAILKKIGMSFNF